MGSEGARVVLHADDVGLCHGANAAFVELSHFGTITAGSVMVPCPWFGEIAAIAAADSSLDVGIHLTLTSEHVGYRWRPISCVDAGSGLTDRAGYLWRSVSDVRAHAHPDAVEAEWRAQIEIVLAAGIDVTHIDAHMGAALAPEWCERYIALGIEYRVPALITRTLEAYGPSRHLGEGADHQRLVDAADAVGMPVFDAVPETDFARPSEVALDAEDLVTSASGGLAYCAFHPCLPGEIEHIDPVRHHVRTEEAVLFATDGWREWLDAQPFEVVTMRQLRDEWRAIR